MSDLPVEQWVSLEPVVNRENVHSYATLYGTRDPWTHVSGRLLELAFISGEIDRIYDEGGAESADQLSADDLDRLVRIIRSRHSAASTEFLRFFGEESS